jgi:transcriptional regulator with XRE-family HTH domain
MGKASRIARRSANKASVDAEPADTDLSAPDDHLPMIFAAQRGMRKESLGSKLYRLRFERKLTLDDVAMAVGVSKPSVWAWENGKARPLPERMHALARVLGVSPDELVDGVAIAQELEHVIDDCRRRIARISGAKPSAVKILIEL